jgi:hypothetical protein
MLFESRPEVVTTLECRVGFRAFFEATDRASLRYPTRSTRFRTLADIANFQIVTTDGTWALEILEAGLHDILCRLGRMAKRARIQLAADRFVVEVEDYLDPASIERIVREILTPLAHLGRAANFSAGVSFLGEVVVADQGRCPVCCQPFVPPVVHCPKCRTPHHPDCWAYWGRCAIFGCRGRGATATSTSRG